MFNAVIMHLKPRAEKRLTHADLGAQYPRQAHFSISAQIKPARISPSGLCFLKVASEVHRVMKDSENMDIAIFCALEEDQMLGRMDSA